MDRILPTGDLAFKKVLGREEERKVISAMERMEANDEAERYYIATENRAIGRAEGIAEGRAEGEARVLAVARNLLSMNLSAEQITAATGLATEEIEKMQTAAGKPGQIGR